MDSKKLSLLHQKLMEKRHELLQRLGRLNEEEITEEQASNDAGDNEDNASDLELVDRDTGVNDILEKNLNDVNHALERMDDGTYGNCEVCGKPIPEKRLEALPWATADVEHADQLQ